MMETRTSSEGVRSFCVGISGAFHGRPNLRRQFVQDSKIPKIWEKRLENPSGRTYNKTICVRRSLEKDQPFMPMPRDASGVYKELMLNMESQGNCRRYGVNHKALETIFGHPQGLLPPEEPSTNIM